MTALNGSTFYGNVFGGGSGYFPYAAGKWHWKAGEVGGNCLVEIKGGHVLTNVYGGNEMTNVDGKCTVNMSGGTIGVPRTLGQILAHPVTCYLFGGGKGDPRVLFNKQTNVQDVEVNITGGWIYGSAFGGGEDGHVMRDVTMNIQNTVDNTDPENPVVTSSPKIGTWGTSYVDGNVFGGGRGFAGDAYTAGNVAGAVTLNIAGGEMLGSIYGGGRLGSVGYGLYDAGVEGYGEMRDDDKMDDGTDGTSFFTKGRGHVEITISGGTIGNNREYIMPTEGFKNWTAEQWTTWQNNNYVPSTTYDASDGKLHHTRGGNVYAGGMGRRLNLAGEPITMAREGINWLKLGNVKSTKLTITGGTIKSNVYGGGEYGAVQGSHTTKDSEDNDVNVGTELIITGGTIGTEIIGASASDVIYTYGNVYGGGTGTTDDVTITTPVANADTLGAYVADSTRITMTNAIVKASVFGGGELSAVGGSTYIDISGTTEIGRNEVRPKSDPNPGYVMFGSWRMGNVYGGGRGSEVAAVAGLVKGNTNINIRGGNVYHMVYGGGALASVGTFDVSKETNGVMEPAYMPVEGIPYQWHYTNGDVMVPGAPDGARTPTGTTNITITGGTIGISGRDNGLVFGGSRGDISDPNVYFTADEIAAASPGDPAYGKTTNDIKDSGFDTYLRLAWVNRSVVNIGTAGAKPTDADYLTTPLIKGSVYGGAENGHNYTNATVNVYSGTIGVTEKIPGTSDDDPWWDFGSEELNKEYYVDRGNVYGAGSGVDTYTDRKGNKHYNPKTGMVGGNTFVNIKGGHIGRSVYGAGSLASVGNITNARDTLDVSKGGTGTAKHANEANGFALSWPYKFVFAPGTGKTTINVTGGHVGTENVDGGDVFGGARGKVGDRYVMAHVAVVNETEVNVDYDTPASESDMPNIKTNFTIPCVTGSVSGSGEDGYVYGDTHVTLNKGLIGHSLYGGGKGKSTYTKTLKTLDDSDEYPAKIYSLIAGKVFGNTYVTMNGGYVGRNVYGGGNMASVGKGNFAGGTDDYVNDNTISVVGYGEKTDGNLWDGVSEDSQAFLGSGKTTVNVISGTVGYIDESNPSNSMKNDLPYGNVIGGSAGEAAPNVTKDPRYEYSPAFFSGYVNETDVTIGGYRCKEAYSTYHVGDCMTAAEFKATYPSGDSHWEIVGPSIRASVYGGGQDGHVRRDTKVTVLGGEIGLQYNSTNQGILGNLQLGNGSLNPQWLHRGNVYGGGSGITKYQYDFNYDGDFDDADEQDYSNSSGSVTRFTQVNVLGGIVHRNVYGGGSLGSVGAPNLGQTYDLYKKGDELVDAAHSIGKQSQCTVNISGQIGTVENSRAHYGGDVFGACRGNASLDAEQFATAVWTRVNILNGATIFGNVFGGGDAGAVKKNAEVVIGDR